MEGFDDPGVFFSDNFAADGQGDDQQHKRQDIKNRFRQFVRDFREGNTFKYRYCIIVFIHVMLKLFL